MTSTVDQADPRAAIAAALAAYLTEDQTKKLVDEVLAVTKRINVTLNCTNCGHKSKGTIDVPDAKAVVGALTDLLSQGFGRPGEAKVDDSAIVFKRLTKLEDENGGKRTNRRRSPRKRVADSDAGS